jgi:hypothetical protein
MVHRVVVIDEMIFGPETLVNVVAFDRHELTLDSTVHATQVYLQYSLPKSSRPDPFDQTGKPCLWTL